MSRRMVLVLLLATGVMATGITLAADDPPAKKPAEGAAAADKQAPAAEAKAKEADAKPKDAGATPRGAGAPEKTDDPNLGMSILGNQEAPKSLVIVPWKGSEIGTSIGIVTMLDDSRAPIDREVFMRVLSYYAVTSTTTGRSK